MCKIRKDKSLEVPSVHTRTDAYAMQRKTTLYTVDENIIVTTKKRNNFFTLKMVIAILDFSLLLPIYLSLFQLCDSKSCRS